MMKYLTLIFALAATVGNAQTTAPAIGTAPLPVVGVPAKSPPPIATVAPTAIVATQVTQQTGDAATLAPNTEILVRLSETVNSKLVREGHRFRVAVAQDVMMGNFIVIPKGTPGVGEVTYRTGKGAFGKSAKMEVEVRSITLPGGREVGMSGKARQEGRGNTGATVGAVIAVGVFSAFVTGRSAVFEEGREVRAFTREALAVTLPRP